MALDTSFSSTSLEFVPGVGSDSGNYSYASFTSSEDLHIGLSPRPKLPFGFAGGPVSKPLPLRSTGNTAAQTPRPAHPLSVSYYQRPRHHLPLQDQSGTYLGGNGNGSHYEDQGSCFSSLLEDDQVEVDDTPRRSKRFRHLTGRYVGLKKRQSSLLAFFDRFHSKRAQTRILRETRDKADREFMDAAQALVSECPGLHRLQQLHDSMRRTHLQYQEAEEQFEGVLDQLRYSRGESEPNSDSDSDSGSQSPLPKGGVPRIAEHAWELTSKKVGSDEEKHSDDVGDITLRGITGDRPEAIFPLYEKLRAAFSRLQLAKELLINTQVKRDALYAQKTQPLMEETLKLLERHGDAGKRKALELREMSVMTEEENEELELYNELEKTARQNIEIYTEKVKSLRQACKENGEMPSFSYLQEDVFGFETFAREDIPLAPGPTCSNDQPPTLAHPTFPLLLYNPTHVLHEFPLTPLQSLKMALRMRLTKQVEEAAHETNMHSLLSTVESNDKNESINRWLLHKLFHSAMEAELLWTVFRARLKILDIDRWQRDVLYFWWHDETVDPALVADGSSHSGPTEAGDKESDTDAGAVFRAIPYSDSGQLEGIRDWSLTDAWSDSE